MQCPNCGRRVARNKNGLIEKHYIEEFPLRDGNKKSALPWELITENGGLAIGQTTVVCDAPAATQALEAIHCPQAVNDGGIWWSHNSSEASHSHNGMAGSRSGAATIP